MANPNQFVELDVGGKLFKASIETLCFKSGYFRSMFQKDSWKEFSVAPNTPIFIDRGKEIILLVHQTTLNLETFQILISLLICYRIFDLENCLSRRMMRCARESKEKPSFSKWRIYRSVFQN
jgi:hypothetical protein